MKTLKTLPIEDLRQRWQTAFGHPPSLAARREFLTRNLYHHQQITQHGGLNNRTLKELETIARGGKPKPRKEVGIRAGTKLIRMWQGEPHEVVVQDSGLFLYRDSTYRSLSAIANHITGTRWNGKVFFGIKKGANHA